MKIKTQENSHFRQAERGYQKKLKSSHSLYWNFCQKLIAPQFQNDIIFGYEWILEQLKRSTFPEAETEICKEMGYLKKHIEIY
ncbi:unnamed protein product [Paramecium octaurelia]|uniref:Uncharacterized protein n=1 Tax=Paramecium octaurelia TaxID=43137 RepID=A0A8S1TV72_PAROT|nr:unnamed protein product [Paramecium octaurelia]